MSKIGYKQTEEHKRKHSGENHYLYGKKHSSGTIKKMSEVKLGENNPNWNGGEKNHNGYMYLLKPDCPCSDNQGYISEHRYIAYKALGRCLKRNEVLHHIDEDRTNNLHENLLICSNSYHVGLHRKMDRLNKI